MLRLCSLLNDLTVNAPHSANCKRKKRIFGIKRSIWWVVYTHTHTQPFYGSLDFVRDNPGELVSEETFTHSHPLWSSNIPICFLHLPRSMASSLFYPRDLQSFYAWQHICYSTYMPWQFRLSVCLSVCLSICLSHGWISQKRLRLGLCSFHHTVAPSL